VGKWHLDIEGDVVSAWFDRVVGNHLAYKDFEAWCRENDQMEAMILNDRSLRSHRPPHMTIPRPKVMPLDPSTTHEAWLTDFALEFLETRPADRPFFMVCSYQGPHPPFKIPEPYYSMYDPDDIPEPANFRPLPNKPEANSTSYYHQIWLDHGDNWEAWKKSVAVYWGFVTMIDDQIGSLLKALENQGILDDTLVIFASDHGEFLGNHGLWQKMMPYEEAVRVPLIMRYPARIRAGLRSQAVVSLIDVMPTLLSVVGESLPEQMLGRDLSQAFRDGAEFQDDAYRFSEHQALGEWHQAVDWRLATDNRYKYVWNQGDLDELYHLDEDPNEIHNRIHAPDAYGEVRRLQTRLHEWMVETDDPLLASFEREVWSKG
jgi:arylsulfatase A-like enzyme